MNTVIFDLDGTLLPMDTDKFNKIYFGEMREKFFKAGKDADRVMLGMKKGIFAMKTNDGENTNEEVFWAAFEAASGYVRAQAEPLFNDFYNNEFDKAKQSVWSSPAMTEAVKNLKQKGYRLIIATDPVFPDFVNLKRIEWAGLSASDFEYISDYSKHRFCKPSADFYREVLDAAGVSPQDAVMIGNNVTEDGGAETAGISLHLIDDCLLNYNNLPINEQRTYNSKVFLTKVNTLPEVG